MAQLTLYLDQETVAKMRQDAETEGLSQWVARLIMARHVKAKLQAVSAI
jgi:hypothetical protein